MLLGRGRAVARSDGYWPAARRRARDIAPQRLKPRIFASINVGAKAPTHKPKESLEEEFVIRTRVWCSRWIWPRNDDGTEYKSENLDRGRHERRRGQLGCRGDACPGRVSGGRPDDAALEPAPPAGA